MPAIDKVLFASFCFDEANFHGVNPHYVVAVAQLRTKIADDTIGGTEFGPFRFTKALWQANRINPEFQPDFEPNEILDWRIQCSVFCRMVYAELNQLVKKNGGQQPSAIDLYLAQLAAAGTPITAKKDKEKLAEELQTAVQETTAAIIEAEGDPLNGVEEPASPQATPETILFRRVPGLAPVKGHLVALVQKALIQRGHLAATDSAGRPNNDGTFGPLTENALEAFQTAMGHPSTGALTFGQWRELTGTPSPDIYQRCAQITAAFEGTGFGGTNKTDIDNTVVTFGYHGYTLAGGNFQKFLQEFDARHPGLLDQIFGVGKAAGLRTIFPPVKVEKAIELGRALFLSGNTVKDEWTAAFEKFGQTPECQTAQIDFSRSVYWTEAEKVRSILKLSEPLSYALCFDVAVQNGNKVQLAKTTSEAFTKGMSEVEKRVKFGEGIVNAAKAAFQADVRSRKVLTLGQGSGVVHGGQYRLENWGFGASESVESNDAPGPGSPPAGNATFKEFFASKLPGITAFSANEFLVKGSKHASNHLNTDPPEVLWKNIIPTVKVLLELKKRLNQAAITLNSAYRSPAYNASVRGATNSEHKKFSAVDLVAHDGQGPSHWARELHQMRNEGFFRGGIGVYGSFVHVDTRGYNADWG